MTDTLSTGWELRTDDGRTITLDVAKWMGTVDSVDLLVLERAVAPVLDVGCGPGRHVHALCQRGMEAVGLDISPLAVAEARRRGAPVLHQSVFGPLLHPGRWCSALLLDGSIGIGGDPVTLLKRVSEFLAPGATLLVETVPPTGVTERLKVCMQGTGRPGDWFAWAVVSARDVATLGEEAGLAPVEAWECGGRWFAQLAVAGAPRPHDPEAGLVV